MNFDSIHKEYFKRLVYFADRIIHDYEQSKDIAQESLIKLWEKFENFDNENAIKSFLYTIVKNTCFDLLKSNKRWEKRVEEYYYISNDIEQEVFFYMLDAEILNELNNGIEKLCKAEKKIFRLSLWGNMNTNSIAEKLGLSIKTVRNQRSKAINKLRMALNR